MAEDVAFDSTHEIRRALNIISILENMEIIQMIIRWGQMI